MITHKENLKTNEPIVYIGPGVILSIVPLTVPENVRLETFYMPQNVCIEGTQLEVAPVLELKSARSLG